MTRQRKAALADEQGRVNLGNHYAGKYFHLDHGNDGTVLLIPVPVYLAGDLPMEVEER